MHKKNSWHFCYSFLWMPFFYHHTCIAALSAQYCPRQVSSQGREYLELVAGDLCCPVLDGLYREGHICNFAEISQFDDYFMYSLLVPFHAFPQPSMPYYLLNCHETCSSSGIWRFDRLIKPTSALLWCTQQFWKRSLFSIHCRTLPSKFSMLVLEMTFHIIVSVVC